MTHDPTWSLTNSAGASSSGSASGIRHSRTQALLAARGPGSDRAFVLVNGFEAWVDHPAGRSHLASQRYAPGITNPDEASRIESFTSKPRPTWRFKVEGDAHVTQEIELLPDRAVAAVRWSIAEDRRGFTLHVRPFISGRDPEALHHQNEVLRTHTEKRGWKLSWRPYEGVPEINAYAMGIFDEDPLWYDNFQFDDGATEDLFSPGIFHSPLFYGKPFELILSAGWEEVVAGMILPEHPVLWAETEAPRAKTMRKAARKPKPKAKVKVKNQGKSKRK
ncbi:MAG: glycogen debranching [Planctomycetota bacterium]|nr:MAG: glycogen debranching [Planctomycetota bacterium]